MSELLALAADLPVRAFAAGDVLIAQGDEGGDIHVLLRGEVDVRVEDRTLVTLRDPGAVLGEISVLLSRPATASVVATTAVRTHVVHAAGGTLADRPAIVLGISRLLARRVMAMTSYLVDLREQYADTDGHLAMMDTVLSALVAADPTPADAGSDREVPGY